MKKQIVEVLPIFKERIWGGNKIKSTYHGNTDIEPVGEMWNVSALPSGDCVIPQLKTTLSHLYSNYPDWFKCETSQLPLHCTLIDPIADLSVQVHPTEEYANIHENSVGKPEAWYIIDAPLNAKIQFGHTAKTREEVVELISDSKWDQLLSYVEAKKKDFLFVPDGHVHAIGKNVLCFEIARNADVTYRLYDYDRIDKKTGKKRDLHVEKSLDVLAIPHNAPGPYTVPEILANGCRIRDYFDQPKVFTFKSIEVDNEGFFSFDRFYFLTCIEGEGNVNEHSIHPGTTLLIPDGFGKIDIKGNITLLLSSYRD
jgi:mannose-6-phosphate isomerase